MPPLSRLPTRAVVLAAVLLFAAPPSPAEAQSPSRPLGVGAHVGEPVGLSARYYDQSDAAYDLLAALNATADPNLFFINVHRVQEDALRPSSEVPLRFFHGPGLLLSTEIGENGFATGVSYTAGLSLLPLDRLEFFLQLTPRLRVLPDTDFVLGGGLGLRYYFSVGN